MAVSFTQSLNLSTLFDLAWFLLCRGSDVLGSHTIDLRHYRYPLLWPAANPSGFRLSHSAFDHKMMRSCFQSFSVLSIHSFLWRSWLLSQMWTNNWTLIDNFTEIYRNIWKVVEAKNVFPIVLFPFVQTTFLSSTSVWIRYLASWSD